MSVTVTNAELCTSSESGAVLLSGAGVHKMPQMGRSLLGFEAVRECWPEQFSDRKSVQNGWGTGLVVVRRAEVAVAAAARAQPS